MKRKFLLIAIAILMTVQSFGQAKYVFFFIGDGMGVNQVNLAEMYLAAQNGDLGYGNLCFTSFPVASVATTYSASSNVTDSAASGTALSTGHKTNNGFMGVDPDGNRLTNIAEMAKRSGKKVGIVTTVGANHATPAAFFGHQKSRNMYDELIQDMAAAGMDFYAGSGLLRSSQKILDDPQAPLKDAGYVFAGNMDDFNAKYATAEKMVMVPDDDHFVSLAINRVNASAEEASHYICLKDYVEASIKFLTKDKKNNGFFIMAEGGEIDHACHGNDAASEIQEVIDFDEAIKVAYDFYLKHPKETAIIIAADHETGGLVLKCKNAKSLSLLGNQKKAEGEITNALKSIMKEKGKTPMTWEEIKDFFKKNLGFWDTVNISPEDEFYLFDIYIHTIAKNNAGNKSDEYGYNHDASIVSAAIDLFDGLAGIHWGTTGHTAGYIPVYAVGVGADKFNQKMDNTEIPGKIAEIGRYK